ncbi:MAG: hypothetical protein WCA77_01865 [Thermoplasmata archaeon]
MTPRGPGPPVPMAEPATLERPGKELLGVNRPHEDIELTVVRRRVDIWDPEPEFGLVEKDPGPPVPESLTGGDDPLLTVWLRRRLD